MGKIVIEIQELNNDLEKNMIFKKITLISILLSASTLPFTIYKIGVIFRQKAKKLAEKATKMEYFLTFAQSRSLL